MQGTNITPEHFYAAVGREPKDDDLERANCAEAGQLGHQDCGWCSGKNLPNFMVSLAERDEDKTGG